MWYFSWILGVTMAVLLAVVNALMCETSEAGRQARERDKQAEER